MNVLAVTLLMTAQASPAARPLSLGAVAAMERQRRSAMKPIVRVYDNEDLGRYTGTVSVSYEAAAPAAPAGPPGKKAKSDDELRAEQRAGFEQQIAENERLKAGIRKAMDAAQLELNDLSNFTYGTRRASLVQLLEDGATEIRKLDEASAEVAEQARRAGIRLSR